MRILALLSLLVLFCVSLTAKAQNPAEPAGSMQDAPSKHPEERNSRQAPKEPHHKQL
jgi:hypothetical protein